MTVVTTPPPARWHNLRHHTHVYAIDDNGQVFGVVEQRPSGTWLGIIRTMMVPLEIEFVKRRFAQAWVERIYAKMHQTPIGAATDALESFEPPTRQKPS